MHLDEKQLIADFEELMQQYEEGDDWDQPAALFIRWDDPDPDLKGCIIVIPTENPADFLHMLLEGGPSEAQAVFRVIGEVSEDMPIAAIALINEGWGLDTDKTPSHIMREVEEGKVRISETDYRIETRLILLITSKKNVLFGNQDRGGHFKWISRTDDPDSGSAGGNIPYLLYPLVTGEPYVEPERLAATGNGAADFRDIRFNRGPDPA